MPNKSFFLTAELCQRVFDRQRDHLLETVADKNRKAFAIAVLNPVISFEEAQGNVNWFNVLVWEGHVGEAENLSRYKEMARLKALEALRLRDSGHSVWLHQPARLRMGQVGWYGGVYVHGIPAGGSGLDGMSDDTVTRVFAEALREEICNSFPWNGKRPGGMERAAFISMGDGFLRGQS